MTQEEQDAFYASFKPVGPSAPSGPNEKDAYILIGDHPHNGCRGHIEDLGETIQMNGVILYRVVLDTCEHHVDECFARAGELRRVGTRKEFGV